MSKAVILKRMIMRFNIEMELIRSKIGIEPNTLNFCHTCEN